ncbi:MAG: EF-P lysine aminoacylase GenX [Dehalococcoidia bacterium]|nr:EF-P lysine aminoacylase GenX [Dehalococcoidia bacterium]
MDEERLRLSRIKPNLERRAHIMELTRGFFRHCGFLEVETPIRAATVAPELQISPVESEGCFLITSPELHMKQLLAAGYENLFQIGHTFRKGERGRWHNPEFTMLEWYRTGGDYLQMIRDTEDLLQEITNGLGIGPVISYQGCQIDLTPPWPRVTVRDAFREAAGWDPVLKSNPVRFDDDLVCKVIPRFSPARPTVLMDYPAAMASLARLKPDDPTQSERAEIFIGGLEIANAYSELADVKEQTERFAREIKQIAQERRPPPTPRRFLEAMAHFPESGGIALGMDRLVMLFCDASCIDEVMAFTVETA